MGPVFPEPIQLPNVQESHHATRSFFAWQLKHSTCSFVGNGFLAFKRRFNWMYMRAPPRPPSSLRCSAPSLSGWCKVRTRMSDSWHPSPVHFPPRWPMTAIFASRLCCRLNSTAFWMHTSQFVFPDSTGLTKQRVHKPSAMRFRSRFSCRFLNLSAHSRQTVLSGRQGGTLPHCSQSPSRRFFSFQRFVASACLAGLVLVIL